jgi:hypothetical protein
MSAHAPVQIDTNSPFMDAAQAMGLVVVPFAIVVLLCLNAFAELPLFWAVADGHAEAGSHEVAAPTEPAAH